MSLSCRHRLEADDLGIDSTRAGEVNAACTPRRDRVIFDEPDLAFAAQSATRACMPRNDLDLGLGIVHRKNLQMGVVERVAQGDDIGFALETLHRQRNVQLPDLLRITRFRPQFDEGIGDALARTVVARLPISPGARETSLWLTKGT